MARAKRRPDRYEFPRGYSATHGAIIVPAASYRAALKAAVTQARTFDAVVHVVKKGRGRVPQVVATCMRQWGSRRVVECTYAAHAKKPGKKSR